MRRKTVAEVMNPDVLKVRDDMSLEELAGFLTDHEITGAPVEDEQGRLVGVVSVVDLAKAAAEQGALAPDRSNQPDYYVRGWQETLDEKEMHWLRVADGSMTVRDIMSQEIFSVSEETPISEVAMMMMKGHVHRLLVLRDGGIVGIVSTSDLLSLLADEVG